MGGFSEEVQNSSEVFDTETNEWAFIRSMENARSGIRLVA
jgi:hypothetical protein